MPGTVLTSMVKRVDVAVFDAIKNAASGTLAPGMHVLGLAEGGIDYVHEGEHARDLPDAVKARVAELAHQVITGAQHVPAE
jgi:basic membrane protein A